ncbi:NAD(P)-binding protein [Choiromyces venosus 120613-1]|uniref:NAD(P)-binding protein n=1 Tax=Choiromyces venosus 120613-1 TaxID=1336337 RepID=A0A3N4J788_9PEZI|nr:NAD(P)-binding protein [Choiromyces venosus 120613-1]
MFRHLISNILSPLYQSGFMQSVEWTLSECPPLKSKVAVITGGQSGIGAEIVKQLLLHEIGHVIVLARSRDKFELARKEWEEITCNEERMVERVEFVECDLTDLKAVDRVGKELLGRLERLDMLFLNAAIPNILAYELSPQGVETIFAANHLGHFHLTNTLLPRLLSTSKIPSVSSTRIIVSTSSLHHLCESIDIQSLTSPTPPYSKLGVAYASLYRYARSKLANILFTKALSRKLANEKVFVNAFFPGNIPTSAMDTWKEHFGYAFGSLPAELFRWVGQSLEDGATTGMFLAAAKQVEKDECRGEYWVPIARKESCSSTAKDERLAERLWVWSEGFVKGALQSGHEVDVDPSVDTDVEFDDDDDDDNDDA